MSAQKYTDDLGYSEFLTKNGLSEEIVRRIMRELAAPIPNSDVDSVFVLAPSQIHGVGMFTARNVSRGEVFPMFRGAVRYNLARYVNHSDAPNAVAHFGDDGDGRMTVLIDMAEGEEVTMDYNDNKAKSMAAAAAV